MEWQLLFTIDRYILFQNFGNTTFLLYLWQLALFASISLAEFKEILPWNEASRANYHEDKRITKFDDCLGSAAAQPLGFALRAQGDTTAPSLFPTSPKTVCRLFKLSTAPLQQNRVLSDFQIAQCF